MATKGDSIQDLFSGIGTAAFPEVGIPMMVAKKSQSIIGALLITFSILIVLISVIIISTNHPMPGWIIFFLGAFMFGGGILLIYKDK